ncbi:MAG: ankyrin repeat domain-containing protein [Pseudomonadota bacterium]|nr:ankyrin repeat domain-containing protein [Pseudomonadota bacterium]
MDNALVNDQQEQKVKEFKGHELQTERDKEVIQVKEALPSDEQSSKHECHSWLTDDEKKRIEAVVNEKGHDSENQARVQTCDSVQEEQLFKPWSRENLVSIPMGLLHVSLFPPKGEPIKHDKCCAWIQDGYLLWCCMRGIAEHVLRLIELNTNVNVIDENGETALMYACKEGHERVVSMLLLAHADFNAIDKNGSTALMYACGWGQGQGHEAVVSQLINVKPDINAKDSNGKTALMQACMTGRIVIVSRLIEAGSDMDVTDNDGSTALMIACYFGFSPVHQPIGMKFFTHYDDDPRIIVKQLIEAGADVNASDKNGKTALMIACMTNCYWLVSELLKAGADVNARDNRGNTAYTYSYNYGGSERMMDILNKVPGSAAGFDSII